MNAHELLTVALLGMTERNETPPCGDPGTSHLWTSDDTLERAQAVRWCRGCPVLDACARAADAVQERWHVWAANDRTNLRMKEAS